MAHIGILVAIIALRPIDAQPTRKQYTSKYHSPGAADAVAATLRLVFLACFAAIELPTVLAMREADGSFEPANLTVRLDAMPRWLHGGPIVMRSI